MDYLSDPLVIQGLCRIKELGMEPEATTNVSVPNVSSSFQGPLSNLTVQQNLQSTKTFNLANLHLNTPNMSQPSSVQQTIPSASIKEENSSSSVSNRLSMDDFNSFGSGRNMGSPQSKMSKRTLTGCGWGNTPKKQKTATSVEMYASLAELKRECIREVNTLLKTCKPGNDPDGVIWNEVNCLNRGIVVGPKAPYSFFKNIANLYPELKNLTDEEKVTNLLIKTSRFVVENLSWMEVIKSFHLPSL